ncbi:MAG: hypothetical protein JXB62_09200 [Pirellulales bacterium]|nr:hypothetical protein [Pirellulales bacterium]
MTDPPKAAQYDQWVRQLEDPWSRRVARKQLVAARAVGSLLECLQSSNESVVWAAIQSLGELQATEAVAPLVDLLEQGTLTLDVAQALTAITGEYFGANAAQWRQWLGRSPAAGPPQADTAECIRQTAGYLGAEVSGSDKSYVFKLSLPEARAQKVAVYFGRTDDVGDQMVVIYSECGPANPKLYEAVLRKNMGIPSGAFAIRDVKGKPQFVMVDTMLALSVTPSTLAKHIENIATRADMVEKSLTKEDRR